MDLYGDLPPASGQEEKNDKNVTSIPPFAPISQLNSNSSFQQGNAKAKTILPSQNRESKEKVNPAKSSLPAFIPNAIMLPASLSGSSRTKPQSSQSTTKPIKKQLSLSSQTTNGSTIKMTSQVSPHQPLVPQQTQQITNNILQSNTNNINTTTTNSQSNNANQQHHQHHQQHHQNTTKQVEDVENSTERMQTFAEMQLTIQEEYEPSRPNDYEELCEERINHRKQLQMRRDLKRRQEEQDLNRKKELQEMERGTFTSIKPVVPGAGRGRGLTMPAWMTQTIASKNDQETAIKSTTNESIVDSSTGQFDDAETSTRMVGGNHSSISKTTTSTLSESSTSTSSKSTSNLSSCSSPILLLLNIVGPGQVDHELQEEVKEECAEKYGAVKKCVIYEVTDRHVNPEEAVRIFVEFCREKDAQEAQIGLNGRFFGGRKVKAMFYDQDRFQKNDLAP